MLDFVLHARICYADPLTRTTHLSLCGRSELSPVAQVSGKKGAVPLISPVHFCFGSFSGGLACANRQMALDGPSVCDKDKGSKRT